MQITLGRVAAVVVIVIFVVLTLTLRGGIGETVARMAVVLVGRSVLRAKPFAVEGVDEPVAQSCFKAKGERKEVGVISHGYGWEARRGLGPGGE